MKKQQDRFLLVGLWKQKRSGIVLHIFSPCPFQPLGGLRSNPSILTVSRGQVIPHLKTC